MLIKVCGMRDGDNIRALEKLDIDWMGFIFYPLSPRYVPDKDEFHDAILSCSKVKVGVFVNAIKEEILRKVAQYRLDYVQLHGDESPDFCQQLRMEGCVVLKAISISSEVDLLQTPIYEPFADYFVFDTKGDGYGGTGKQFNWAMLDAYRGSIPFLLSGGIGMDHISAILSFAHPLMVGVDLNSRFEVSPALKDVDRVEEFVSQISVLKKNKK
jgi:phosphoribosylanthranilate isomerase